MSSLLSFWPLLLMMVLGMAFWAFGQFLRRRGWADRLDRIDAKVTQAQARAGHITAPIGSALMGTGFALSHIPLLGSKRSKAMWDGLKDEASKAQSSPSETGDK